MRQDIVNYKLILAGIALTLAALAGVELLPARELALMAPGKGAYGPYLITPDGRPSDGSVRWVDEKKVKLHCRYTEVLPYMACGIAFVLTGEDKRQGLDLSRFDSVEIDMDYKGPATFVRLGIRNFDRRFSTLEDQNSTRFQAVNLRQRDISEPVKVDLSELTVAEWWILKYDLAHEYNRAGFENAVAVLIDLPLVKPDQDHEMQIRGITFRGQWVSRDRVYLGILCAWLLGAMLMVVNGWTQLRKAHRLQQREIDALMTRTRQLRVEQDKLRRLATIDELTGVLNRRGMEQALDDLEEAARGMTLVMLDIDHFKQVNDRHGHDGGDEVLRRVTAVVAANLRASDAFGRWGGEEFLIAAQGNRLRDAVSLAEKLRERLQASDISVAGSSIRVTASFGVALASPGAPAAGALKRADEALYRAKAAGRNRVEMDKSPSSDSPTNV